MVPAGGSAQGIWFLEPSECWFTFENRAGALTLTITEWLGRAQPHTQLLQVTSTVASLLMPFCRALTALAARMHSEAHWPRVDRHKLDALGKILAANSG